MSFSAAGLARLGEALRREVEGGTLAGAVALLARGAAVHVEAVGVQDLAGGAPMRRDTIFRIASMTKPMAAAVAMQLVEEGRVGLDDPVDPILPELAGRRVLRAIDGPLEDTVPAARPVTLRDLLTFRCGIGAVMAALMGGPQTPFSRAMAEAGLAPGPVPPQMGPDEYMRRVGGLPLAHQPGERWMYHTGSDILGVLLARLAGSDLPSVMQGRLLGPLGMRHTGFVVPEEALDRLATAYRGAAEGGPLAVIDPARGGTWSRPPVFPSAGGGLAATADDVLAFGRMMLSGGGAVLRRASVAAMVTDQLTPAQKAVSPFFPGFWDSHGWGLGLCVTTRRDPEGGGQGVGSYGWDGGFGTTFWCDPAQDLVAVLLTQRVFDPVMMRLHQEFRRLAYGALAG